MKKNIVLGVCCSLLWISCTNSIEEQAAKRLDKAKAAFEQGSYNEAKLQIDSIKILYPKAYDTRKEGIGLMQQVELKEQTESLKYLDSILHIKQTEVASIEKKYVLEKDTAYQKIGNFFWPTQTVERNMHRSYLRFQVNELGVMNTTSIYCGKTNIHHTAIKVTAPDGTFAQTSISKDVYETNVLGEKIEKADYKIGEDGNVMGFIALNKANQLKLTFLGDRTYQTTLSKSDKQAAEAIYKLGKILSSIEEIKKEQKETRLKIEFVSKKMKDRAEKQAATE